MVLLTLLKTFKRCSSNVNSKLKVIPECFWELAWEKISLRKTSEGWILLFIFRLNIPSWACLLTPGLKLVFDWNAQLLIFLRSSFSSLADKSTSWVTENKDAPPANSFTLDDKLSDRSLIDACGTPAFTPAQAETWLLSTTLCFLLLKKSLTIFNKPPEMPFCCSLKISPLCQILSKALDIFKKTLLT